MDLKNAPALRRKAAPDNPTDGKRKAADWIEAHVVDEGRWPMQYQDITAEIDADPDIKSYSRQHITNTLHDYFEPVRRPESGDDSNLLEVPIPNDVRDEHSYLRGYLDARYRDRD